MKLTTLEKLSKLAHNTLKFDGTRAHLDNNIEIKDGKCTMTNGYILVHLTDIVHDLPDGLYKFPKGVKCTKTNAFHNVTTVEQDRDIFTPHGVIEKIDREYPRWEGIVPVKFNDALILPSIGLTVDVLEQFTKVCKVLMLRTVKLQFTSEYGAIKVGFDGGMILLMPTKV